MKSPYIYIVIVYLRVSYLRVCKMQQYIMILLYTVAEFFSSKYADFFAQKPLQSHIEPKSAHCTKTYLSSGAFVRFVEYQSQIRYINIHKVINKCDIVH